MLRPLFKVPSPHALLRDRLHIHLHPRQLQLVRLSGGLKPRVVAQQLIKIDEETIALHAVPSAHSSLNDWAAVVAMLKSVLKAALWNGAKAEIVLSNHFVRYVVIPWNAGISSLAEEQAFIRHHFLTAFGDPAREWDLQMSPAGYGKASLGSGVSRPLLEAVKAECQAAGLQVSGIVPQLMHTTNAVLPQLKSLRKQNGVSFWMADIEPGRAVLALIEDAGWTIARSVAFSDPEELPALIRRESILQGVTETFPIYMHADASTGIEARKYITSGMEIRRIDMPGTVYRAMGYMAC